MKKLLYIALAALIAFSAASCSGKKSSGGKKNYILFLSVAEKYSIAMNAGSGFLPVEVDPVGASLSTLGEVRCEPEGTISCSLTDKGINITPLAVGKTTLTVSSKANSDIYAQCEITVTEKPAEPKSVTIVKTDSHFSGGVLTLAAGETFQLSATVKNDLGAVTSEFPVEWSLVEGEGNFEVTSAGKITAGSGTSSANGKVKVALKDYPAISDQVSVSRLTAPTGITINPSCNADGELIMKNGKTSSFTFSFSPSTAIQVPEIVIGDESALSASVSGKTITLTAVKKSREPITVKVRSAYNTSVSKEFKVYIYQYDASDVKEGDYVYCNGTLFESKDCGLREPTAPPVYVNNSGKRTTTPKALPTASSGYTYIGVVVTPNLPDKADFLECSRLYSAKNGSSATDLYEYGNLRKTEFCGFTNAPSAHALVLRKDQFSKTVWSPKLERIATTTDKKDGISQSQLWETHFAFCLEEANWLTNYYTEIHGGCDPEFTYCAYGFISHLLLKFYSTHIRDNDFRVIPVLQIYNDLNDVPKASARKGTTGWFLPGAAEFSMIWWNLIYVNASLALGGTQLSGDYWSTCETNYATAFSYNINSSNNIMTANDVDKDSFTAYTRAVLYL